MKQELNSTWFRCRKLHSKLDTQQEEVSQSQTVNDCCDFELINSEKDLSLIEPFFDNASDLTITEKSTLYYICGYVCNKEKTSVGMCATRRRWSVNL